MPRAQFRPPVRHGDFLEELHHPDGRVFPLGQRRMAWAPVEETTTPGSLPDDEQRVLDDVARRRGSVAVETLSRALEMPDGRVRTLLNGLCRLGLIIVEEKNLRPALGIEFQVVRAEIDRRAQHLVDRWMGRRAPDETQAETLAVLDLQLSLLVGNHPLVVGWRERIESHRVELLDGGRPRLSDGEGTIAQYPGTKYLSVLRACVGLALAVAAGGALTLRELSDRTCGHSKALDGYRSELGRAMGCALDELGLISDLPQVFVKVPAMGTVGGRQVWLDGGVPFVMLPGPSVEQIRIECQEARAILAVENKAVFRHLIEVAGLPDGVGCLWLHGQRGIERRLLAQLVAHTSVPVFVWTDVDVWGIYIQDAVAGAARSAAGVFPVLMEPSVLLKAATPQRLTDYHRSLLSHLPEGSRWYSLAQAMVDRNEWVEQEEFLSELSDARAVERLLDHSTTGAYSA